MCNNFYPLFPERFPGWAPVFTFADTAKLASLKPINHIGMVLSPSYGPCFHISISAHLEINAYRLELSPSRLQFIR